MVPTERSLNNIFRIPNKKNKFPISIPTLFSDYDINKIKINDMYYYSKFWNYETFIMLDIIVQKLLKTHYILLNHTSIPLSPYDQNCLHFLNKYNLEEEINSIILDPQISFCENELLMEYPFLKKYNIYQILSKSLCNNEILLPYYKVRYLLKTDLGLKFPYMIYTKNTPEVFLNLSIKEDIFNNKVRDRLYTIDFKSNLSKYFYSNCISLNIDFMNDTFYDLSEITQSIYRLIISNMKNSTIQITTENIAAKVGLNLDNVGYYNKVIQKHLNILKENKYITNFKYIRAKFCYVIIEKDLELKKRNKEVK